MDNEFKQWSFKFVSGTSNGKPAIFAQVWLTDAIFCTVEQGIWDAFAYRFKFRSWPDMPKELAEAIQYAYVATFKPERKDFREHRPAGY